MQLLTSGDLESLTFLTNPKNWVGIRNFLRGTGLGHTTNITYDRKPAWTSRDEASDSDSPEPDFGAFEP